MLIKKKGIIVSFICKSCGCEFDCGIKSVIESDGNYYCNCPMCGTDCHADVNDVNDAKNP